MPYVITGRQLDALVAATALSLYTYNRPVRERAQRLYDFFDGDCYPIDDLVEKLLRDRGAFLMTDLPASTAAVYLLNALEMYEGEARHRVLANLEHTASPTAHLIARP